MEKESMMKTNRVKTRAISKAVTSHLDVYKCKRYIELSLELMKNDYNLLAYTCLETALEVIRKLEDI